MLLVIYEHNVMMHVPVVMYLFKDFYTRASQDADFEATDTLCPQDNGLATPEPRPQHNRMCLDYLDCKKQRMETTSKLKTRLPKITEQHVLNGNFYLKFNK